MARYDKQHKEATRARILQTAGERLKRDGIDGSGVATLMKDAGLTNGAFYAHFDSKDHLVSEVVSTQLQSQVERFADLPAGVAGIEQLVRGYLTAGHRDDPAHGCPSAALLDEVARADDATRAAYSQGVISIVDAIAARIGGGQEVDPATRVQALSAYALMVGTIQLARALTDEDLSQQVIDQGVVNVMELLGS